MLDALYCVDLDIGFLVAGNVDVGKNQQRLRAIGDVKSAVEAHRLDATFLAASFVEGVGKGYGLVVDLVGKMRWQQCDRQGDRRLDFHAEFLTVVVWSHQTVGLGYQRYLVFFVEDATPVELGLNAIVVLDMEIVGEMNCRTPGPRMAPMAVTTGFSGLRSSRKVMIIGRSEGR